MRRSYANFWSHAAAGFTSIAHTRASLLRWGVLLTLIGVWFGVGMNFWTQHYGFWEAAYRTVAAFSMYDDYFAKNERGDLVVELQVVRFAALLLPVVSLAFAFSGQLGSSLARLFNLAAARHVVITGDCPAALSLARDCRANYGDAVMLIAQDVPTETALGLLRAGVVVLEGDATNAETLRTARAHHASHVVAFEPDDTANLQIEAAVRRLVGTSRRRPPIGVHVSTRSPMLLREAREMRSAQMLQRHGKPHAPEQNVDHKPFSLEEIAARGLIQTEAQTLLQVADDMGNDKLHLIFFGFDDAAEALAVRALMTLWSVKFGAPRITVLTPNRQTVETRFHTRHREAFAHPDLWAADMVFLDFDWDMENIDPAFLQRIESERGKPCGAIVSTGVDPTNIHFSLALKRVCNYGRRWPIPIYMKETSQSEFSRLYAQGAGGDERVSYLQAFGGHQVTATRACVLDGMLDQGAAIAHEHYNRNLGARALSMRELQAAMRDWQDVIETYRAANRAAADSAIVKMWDAGWRPALANEKGETAPAMPEAMADTLAQTEHKRWVAERLLSGWKPGGRDNEYRMHDKLREWAELPAEERSDDIAQVNASRDVVRLLYPKGLMARRRA